MYQNDAMKVLTGEVRLSYANLTTPRAAQQGGEPKYSVTLLIPKSDAATKADIDAAIQAAANEAMAKVWNGARPPMLKVPIYEGDGPCRYAIGVICIAGTPAAEFASMRAAVMETAQNLSALLGHRAPGGI